MKKTLALICLCFTSYSVASPDTQTGGGSLIIDNSSNPDTLALVTNLRTSLNGNACVATTTPCNSIGTDKVVILQARQSGTLQAHTGLGNNPASLFEARGTPYELDYFDPPLFDLQTLRDAADWLAERPSSLPAASYGTITWEQFVNNVAKGRTMYGIVRVKVPLVPENEISEPPATDNYGGKFSKASLGSYSKSSYSKKKSGKKARYRFCPKNQPQSRCGCTPNEETPLQPGKTVCGTKLGKQAKIDVRGSLFFDFVDCDTGRALELGEFPEDADLLELTIKVPTLVNPASPGPDGQMSRLQEIAALSPPQPCPAGQSCSRDLNLNLSVNQVPLDRKQQYFADNDRALTATEFASLKQAQQYSLLAPSGYADGWLAAFQALNMSASDWSQFFPGSSNTPLSGSFDEQTIRSGAFEDIPAYIHAGGKVSFEHQLNISGLMYIPQKLKLGMDGIQLEEHSIEHEDDDDYRSYHDDDYKSKHSDVEEKSGYQSKQSSHYEKDGYITKKFDSDDDDKSIKTYTNTSGKSCKVKAQSLPTWHYVRGAIIVRDGFEIEVDGGGLGLLSNDPASYSQTRINPSSQLATRFEPFSYSNFDYAGDNGSSNGTGNDGDSAGSDGQTDNSATSQNGSAEWVEIRAR